MEGVAAIADPTGSHKTQIWKYVESNMKNPDIKIFTVRLNKLVEKKALQKVKMGKFMLTKEFINKILA